MSKEAQAIEVARRAYVAALGTAQQDQKRRELEQLVEKARRHG